VGAVEYFSAVTTDTPWGFWEGNESSGSTLNDTSGNAKHMAITAPLPLFGAVGPFTGTGMPAVEWPQGGASLARTHVTTGLFTSATCTIETWVFVPASATMGRTALVSTMSESTSSAVCNMMLGFETDGSIILQNNAAQIAGPILARGVWYHVVGSVGAAGLKLRVDKVTVALDAARTSTGTTGYSVFIRREKNSTGTGADYRAGTQVRLGPTSIYASQLSDARTDAHYDAAREGFVERVQAAATRTEVMAEGQRLHAASTRLGVLLLEYVPIHVAANRVSAVVDGSPWIQVAETHVEVLVQERVPWKTVRDIPVKDKREHHWEQGWYHWSDSDGV